MSVDLKTLEKHKLTLAESVSVFVHPFKKNKDGTARKIGPRKATLEKALGKRFGRIVVDEVMGSPKGIRMARCKCDCGEVVVRSLYGIFHGKIKSCGCFRRDFSSAKATTHGMSRTRVYTAYCNMLKRCYDVTGKSYHLYGGKGIVVCERWLEPNGVGFLNFFHDMGHPPDGLTLERQKGNLSYCKENCVWDTPTVQANNTSRNRFEEMDGRIQTRANWAREFGLSYQTLCKRLSMDWPFEKAIKTPPDLRFRSVGNLCRSI